MINTVILALTLTGQIPDDIEQPPKSKVSIHLRIKHFRIQWFDPLFVQVLIVNKTNVPIQVPHTRMRRAGYKIVAEPFCYRFEAEQVISDSGPFTTVLPGEFCTLDYEILPVPPIEMYDHDFWRMFGPSGRGADVEAVVLPDGMREYDSQPLSRLDSQHIWLVHRPEAEMVLLRRLYAESLRRDEEHLTVVDIDKEWDRRRPTPSRFGLKSFRPDEDLTQELLAAEEDLSPGTLRDIVHLTRLCRTIYDSGDEQEQQWTVDELLAWLDTLHEVERHCLAHRIIPWAVRCGERGKLAFFRLADGAIDRLPPRLYGFEDYHAYVRGDYSGGRPRFKNYLKQRKPSDAPKLSPPVKEVPPPVPGSGAKPSPDPFGPR